MQPLQIAHKSGNDTAFVLGYSTIQLNTDAHNPKLDDAGRMTKKMFLDNNRRSPDLAVLDDAFVGQLYDEIVNEEITLLDENDLAAMNGPGEVRCDHVLVPPRYRRGLVSSACLPSAFSHVVGSSWVIMFCAGGDTKESEEKPKAAQTTEDSQPHSLESRDGFGCRIRHQEIRMWYQRVEEIAKNGHGHGYRHGLEHPGCYR
jgi:hypothetical protein